MKTYYDIVVLGRTNAGKSSLLNYLTKSNTCLTSQKSQTTRRIQQVTITNNNTLYHFWDTPGITKQKNLYDKYLVKRAINAANEHQNALLIILLAANKPINDNTILFLKSFDNLANKKLLVFTKVDLVDADLLEKYNQLKQINLSYAGMSSFSIYQHSDLYVSNLFSNIQKFSTSVPLKNNKKDNFSTKVSELTIDLVKDYLNQHTYDELSHVTIPKINEIEFIEAKKLLKINGEIFCEKPGQKRILIGKNANFIKGLNIYVRKNLEKILNLNIFVKFEISIWKNWTNDNKFFSINYEGIE